MGMLRLLLRGIESELIVSAFLLFLAIELNGASLQPMCFV